MQPAIVAPEIAKLKSEFSQFPPDCKDPAEVDRALETVLGNKNRLMFTDSGGESLLILERLKTDERQIWVSFDNRRAEIGTDYFVTAARVKSTLQYNDALPLFEAPRLRDMTTQEAMPSLLAGLKRWADTATKLLN